MSTSEKIIFDASLGEAATEWYGTIVLKNIRYKDDSPVQIEQFLGVRFKAPALTGDLTAQTQLTPWQATVAEISTEKLGDNKASGVRVSAKLRVESSHTFKPADTVTFGVNGNLIEDGAEGYLASVEVYADEMPVAGEEGKEE